MTIKNILAIILIILILAFVLGYMAIRQVNSFFEANQLQFNQILKVEIKSPIEIKKREVDATTGAKLKQDLEEIRKEKEELEKKLESRLKEERRIALLPVAKSKTLSAALRKWGMAHLKAFEDLIGNKESGFNPLAFNRKSGACGIFQALPCSKMRCELENIDCQVAWGISYIERRYGTPSKALAFWMEKKQTTGNGWY